MRDAPKITRMPRFSDEAYDGLELPGSRLPPSYSIDAGSDTSRWAGVVVSANVLLAVILIAGMMWDGQSIVGSIITGAVYYMVTTITVIGIISGQASEMWRSWQHERTERRRISALEYLSEYRMDLESRSSVAPPVSTSSTPSPDNRLLEGKFVPPFTPAVVEEARSWTLKLYGRDGYLDPKLIRSGYVQVGMLGSKRMGGSSDARQLLIDLRVVKQVEGGFVFNVKRLPHVDDAERFFTDLRGRAG